MKFSTSRAFRSKPQRILFTHALATALLGSLCPSLWAQAPEQPNQQQDLIIVTEIAPDHLTYIRSERKGVEARVDLSDLDISSKIVGKQDPLGTYYVGVPDFKEVLLQRGLARLKNSQNSAPKYVSAQQYSERNARTWHIGSFFGDIWEWITSLSRRVWGVLLTLGALGLTGVIFQRISNRREKRRRERQVRLLIIGVSAVGKTALRLRLLDPEVDPKELLGVQKSPAKVEERDPNFVPYGQLEIYPTVVDVPGSAYSTVWDQLVFEPPDALVVTLAATDLNTNSSGHNDRFVADQLNFIHAFITGYLGSSLPHKPKMVIVFVNKFDLFSSHDPNDESSDDAKKSVETMFKEHIEATKSAVVGKNIKVELIVGSALKGWCCDRVIKKIAKGLYGR